MFRPAPGVLCLWIGLAGMAGAQTSPPLARSNFTMASPQGFGDRQNSWPWSMEWFKGNRYVGTFRSGGCVYAIGQQPYPPADPDISCPADPTDLGLQAEIWSWSPVSGWSRVYQSPRDIPIPGASGKFVARDIGFRGMTVFTEPDGTQALYVSGCSANQLFPGIPGGRLLRSVDGITFTPVPQDPGTVLGTLGNACFRGAVAFNNKFYIVATTSLDSVGVLLEATDPKLGDNNFRLAAPVASAVSEVGAFNGFLYIAGSNPAGFTLSKSPATGTPPYTFTSVMVNAGYSTSAVPNVRALSLQVFNGFLYVGGQSTSYLYGSELFRVHADDTWDLIAGTSRSTPVGQKTSLSGFGPGFNWPFNTFERMEVFDSRLYLGTFDASDGFRFYNNPTFQMIARPQMGFDLWVTTDGIHFSRVDGQGFGDILNQGVRTLKTTPYGLFLGAANWFYGLEIWRGVP